MYQQGYGGQPGYGQQQQYGGGYGGSGVVAGPYGAGPMPEQGGYGAPAYPPHQPRAYNEDPKAKLYQQGETAYISRNRTCRDILFLILFIAFWAGMGFVAFFAFKYGDPTRLVAPVTASGEICGVGKMSAYPSLYWPMPTQVAEMIAAGNKGVSICVAKCPKLAEPFISGPDGAVSAAPSIYDTQEMPGLKHFCVPTNTDAFTDVFQRINQKFSGLDAQLSYVVSNWNAIAAAVGIALGASLVWLILMRFAAAVMVWMTVLMAVLVAVAATILAWYKAGYISVPAGFKNVVLDKIDAYAIDHKLMLGIAIALTIVTVVLLLVVLVMFTRIMIAVGIVREASAALGDLPGLFVFPLLTLVLLLVLWVYWLSVFGYLASAGEWNISTLSYNASNTLRGLIAYHFFGLLWTAVLIEAIQECTIAGAVATWYFTRDKKSIPFFTVGQAFGRSVTYHLGSLALGSLLIAVVKFIRAVLAYIERKFKELQNPVVKYVCCCVQCCLWCFEKFLKFITRNAYIEIAITGKSFCSAAADAFGLLLRNVLRVAAVGVISDFLLFLGKLAVTVGTMAACAAIMTNGGNLATAPILPIILCGLIAYGVSSAFFTICSMAIDTILFCFCEDCEKHEATGQYYMRESLRDFIDSASRK
eukprot:tig00001239_g7767.t1